MIALATCAAGAEKILSGELRKIKEKLNDNIRVLKTGYGNVCFETDKTGLYFSLMSLRTADRIFLVLSEFFAADFDEIFNGAAAIPLENYIPEESGLSIDKVKTRRSKLYAETSIQAVVHKACAERLCKLYKVQRLNDTADNAVLRVYVDNDNVQILLDLCGKPLFKRGYRIEGGFAPLRETTAAALLLMSGWRRKFPLYDPFCGSGTIAIEAALYGWNIAPGIFRDFAIQKLLIADADIENSVRSILLGNIDFTKKLAIYGSDEDNAAVETAKSNLQRVLSLVGSVLNNPVPAYIPKFWTLDMKVARSQEEFGFVFCNPPYGKRLGDTSAAEASYAEMSVLMQNFPAWKLNIISNHIGFESFFGKKSTKCKKITNGPIDVYFYEYDFKGKKPDRIDRTDRIDRSDRIDRTDWFGRTERTEHSDRVEHTIGRNGYRERTEYTKRKDEHIAHNTGKTFAPAEDLPCQVKKTDGKEWTW